MRRTARSPPRRPGVDALLVGDSLGNVLLGYDRTRLPVTLDEMIHHARAVGRVRAAAAPGLVDMPWLSYHLSPEDALRNAARRARDRVPMRSSSRAGAKRVPAIRAILDCGDPGDGHIGLTPQSVLHDGRLPGAGPRARTDAEALVEDGPRRWPMPESSPWCSRVFPADLARAHHRRGRRADDRHRCRAVLTDGQVLVYHDLLGMLPERAAEVRAALRQRATRSSVARLAALGHRRPRRRVPRRRTKPTEPVTPVFRERLDHGYSIRRVQAR